MINVATQSKTFTKEDFRKRAWTDHQFFVHELFPEGFYVPFSRFHIEIIRLLYADDRYIGVIAPRKFGKTPTICFSYPIKQILYNLESYIVIISETMDESRRHVQKITANLEGNEKIHYYYGKYVDRKNRETQKESVQYANGIWLRAKSYLSQIRGTSGDWSPPSLIIGDDLQSDKDVKTENSLIEAENWWENEVMFSAAVKWKHPHFGTISSGKIRVLGTSLHHLCLVEKLYKDPRFKFKRYGILMNKEGEPDLVNGTSIWEEMWSTEEVRASYRAACDAGKEKNWLQEKMNMPYSYGDRIFDPNDNRHWDRPNNKFDIINGIPVLIMESDLGILKENYN